MYARTRARAHTHTQTYTAHVRICWWKVVIVTHHQRLVITNERVPVVSEVELLVCHTRTIVTIYTATLQYNSFLQHVTQLY